MLDLYKLLVNYTANLKKPKENCRAVKDNNDAAVHVNTCKSLHAFKNIFM